MKNPRARSAAAAQASILWCNHPKLQNHPAPLDCLVILEQTPPDTTTKQQLEQVRDYGSTRSSQTPTIKLRILNPRYQ